MICTGEWTEEQVRRAAARLREIEVKAVIGLREEETEWAAREVLEAAVKPTREGGDEPA